jgi:hypothetical protein
MNARMPPDIVRAAHTTAGPDRDLLGTPEDPANIYHPLGSTGHRLPVGIGGAIVPHVGDGGAPVGHDANTVGAVVNVIDTSIETTPLPPFAVDMSQLTKEAVEQSMARASNNGQEALKEFSTGPPINTGQSIEALVRPPRVETAPAPTLQRQVDPRPVTRQEVKTATFGERSLPDQVQMSPVSNDELERTIAPSTAPPKSLFQTQGHSQPHLHVPVAEPPAVAEHLEPPKVRVYFEVDGSPFKSDGYFHQVIRNRQTLVLVYDTRVGGYPRSYPQPMDASIACWIAGGEHVYICNTTGIEFTLDNYDVCILLIKEEHPYSE